MQANLIIICDEGNDDFIEEARDFITQQFGKSLVGVRWYTFMPLYSTAAEISKNLTDNTIIALGFCESNTMRNVKSACDNYYNCSSINTNYGQIYKNGNRACSVVDLSSRSFYDLNAETLKVLYDVDETICLKIFGLNDFEIIERLHQIPNLNMFDFSFYSHYGDTQLVLGNKTGQGLSSIERDLYEIFGDLIYSDESKTLLECANEIMVIRKERFAVADYVTNGFINNQLNNSEVLNNYNIQLNRDELDALANLDNASLLLQSCELQFIVSITGNLGKTKISLIDSDFAKTFTLSQQKESKYNLKYLTNFVLYKIFSKLRKNTLLF